MESWHSAQSLAAYALQQNSPMQNVAYDPNGRWMVASDTDCVLHIFEHGEPSFNFALTAHEIKMSTLMRVRSMSFDYNLPILYIACGNLIWALHLENRSILWTATTSRLFAFQGIIANEVCAHPNGYLAYAFDNGHFGLRSPDGIRLKSWRHNAGPRWMGFCNHASTLVGSDGFAIHEWDTATGLPSLTYQTVGRIMRLSTSVNDPYFAVRTLHHVHVFEVGNRVPLLTADVGSGLPLLAFSKEKPLLAVNSDDEIRIYHFPEGEVRTLSFKTSHPQGLAFSHDGSTLAIAGSDGSVHSITLESNR